MTQWVWILAGGIVLVAELALIPPLLQRAFRWLDKRLDVGPWDTDVQTPAIPTPEPADCEAEPCLPGVWVQPTFRGDEQLTS